jgi:predicted secreted protein
MKIGTLIAIYFVTWWVTLFMVLPFGVKNADEAGEVVEKGNERGAPVTTRLLMKVMINTVLAAIVTAVIWWLIKSGVFAG